jgi:hypothetical protein
VDSDPNSALLVLVTGRNLVRIFYESCRCALRVGVTDYGDQVSIRRCEGHPIVRLGASDSACGGRRP